MTIRTSLKFSALILILLSMSISENALAQSALEKYTDEGEFLVFRRQSQIGTEKFSISTKHDVLFVNSLQGENERGRITGVTAELRMDKNLTPLHYENKRIANGDTTNIFMMQASDKKVSIWEKAFEMVTEYTPELYFPVHSNIPAAVEIMLYHYYFKNNKPDGIPTFPRGEVSIKHTAKDVVEIKGKKIALDRYVVEGINWGGRTIWLDESNNLIALVKANTQIRELIRKGYEEALPVFIAGNVEEQMRALSDYTISHKVERPTITALVGGDIVDGLSDVTKKNMTILIDNGRISQIGKRSEVTVPTGAKVIDVAGKTLMPGLWDMHAHSNQVQWAPAYLAGGITTIRDNGNEIEFATAFRDAIAENNKLGPDILLAGMTDGPGVKGNGVIRARSPQEAREVVDMYNSKGYKQIKIYTSIEPEILKILADEAHKIGLTTTGHVPRLVGNATNAIESGLDMLSHRSRILTVLFPDNDFSDFKINYLTRLGANQQDIDDAIQFLLKHKTVLDPTIALDVVRGLPTGSPLETVEPEAFRIAYELFEGKRFRSGVSDKRSVQSIADYTRAMEILGQFHKAGIPIVAGTDNVVPVYSLYLELETYHKLGKLSPLETIQSASIVPARAMGLDSETGTLEVGKEADIAILEKNPLLNISNIRTVSAVLTNGNYFESDPLWKAADFLPRNN